MTTTETPKSDLGYSGWVQFDDGTIYVVTYLLDDSPKGQIRGYSFRMEDFSITGIVSKTINQLPN
ncbi:MAG: hypothetical protein ACOX2V_09355 [Clostridia bacterium]